MVTEVAQTKQGELGEHTWSGAESSGMKVSPDRHLLYWASLLSYLQGIKDTFWAAYLLFWFYILCLNPGTIVPKENSDCAGRSPPLSPKHLPPMGFGAGGSEVLSGSSHIFFYFAESNKCGANYWGMTISVGGALGLVCKHRHFCVLSSGWMCPTLGSEPSSPKVYKSGLFWKYV